MRRGLVAVVLAACGVTSASAQGIGCAVASGTVTCRVIRVDTVVVSFPAIHDTVPTKPTTPPVIPAPPPAPSPVVPPASPVASTGHPRFLATAARQASWSAFHASGHPWETLVHQNCVKTGTAAARYGDDGTWCGLLYAFEGDTAAARKAIALELHAGVIPPDANTERQNCGSRIILADWLDGAMTQSQRDSAFTLLNGWVRWGIKGTGVNYVGGFRTDDGDQSTTTYLCAALMDRYTRGTPRATHWLDSTMTAPGFPSFALGNLGAAGATERANLARYAGMCAQGGEWDESTEYNPNTVKLAAMDYLAIHDADGVDSLPDLRACFTAIAARNRFDVTSDTLHGIQWGDEEHPLDLIGRLYEREGMTALVAAAGDSAAAANGLILTLSRKYGLVGYNSAEPIVDGAWWLSVYRPNAAADTTLPDGIRYSSGRGHLVVRSKGTTFFAQAEQPTGEDHQPGYEFNVQLYRGHEWALQAPTGYGAPFNVAGAENGVVYAGFAAMAHKGVESVDSSGGRWCITGSTSGGLYAAGYYQPPAAFLTLGRRTTCYAQIQGVDVVIVRDSVVTAKPTVLSRYRAADLAVLDTTGGWFQVWHPQTTPTRHGNAWTWTTAGGQAVQLSAFASTVSADALLDEHTMAYPGAATNPTLGYQLHLRTPDPVLTTVVVIGSALPVSVTGKVVTVGGVTITLP